MSDTSFSSVEQEITQALRQQKQSRPRSGSSFVPKVSPSLLQIELDRLAQEKAVLNVQLEKALLQIEHLYEELLAARREIDGTRAERLGQADQQFRQRQQHQTLVAQLRRQLVASGAQVKACESKFARQQQQSAESSAKLDTLKGELQRVYEQLRKEAFDRTRLAQDRAKVEQLVHSVDLRGRECERLQGQLQIREEKLFEREAELVLREQLGEEARAEQERRLAELRLREEQVSAREKALKREEQRTMADLGVRQEELVKRERQYVEREEKLLCRARAVEEREKALGREKRKALEEQTKCLELQSALHREGEAIRSGQMHRSGLVEKSLAAKLSEAEMEIKALRGQLCSLGRQEERQQRAVCEILGQPVSLRSVLKFVRAVQDMLVKLGRGSGAESWQERLRDYWKALKDLAKR